MSADSESPVLGAAEEQSTTALPEELGAVAEASQDIAAELSLDRLLHGIADHARRIVGCRYAALGITKLH